MTWTNFIPYFATVAAVLMLIGFASSNPIKLRSFAILGNLCFILYFFLVADQPLWTAIVAAAAIVAVNIYMMSKIIEDHRKFKLTAEEMMLYARLPGLTPGQFKQLLGIAEWQNPKSPLQLTEEGKTPSALHYVLEGQVKVNRSGKNFAIGPHAFIGELAFLRQKPATATTHSEAGALIVSWPQQALRTLMQSNEGIRKALDGLLSGDMAEKIAKNAAPFLQEHA